MSERISQAKVFGPIKDQFVDEKRSADQLGFAANQHGRSGTDVEMDKRWRARGESTIAPTDVTAKELEENTRVASIRQRVREIAGDDDVAHQQSARRQLEEQFNRIGMSDMLGEVNPFEAGQMRAANQPRPAMAPEPVQAPTGTWKIEEMVAQTKSGQQVLIWQVRDQRSGITIPHRFRLAETADRVVAVLNRSGNVNDPRVGQWIRIDEQRRQLLAKSRQLRESVQAGNRNMQAQYTEVRQQLAELDLKIGI